MSFRSKLQAFDSPLSEFYSRVHKQEFALARSKALVTTFLTLMASKRIYLTRVHLPISAPLHQLRRANYNCRPCRSWSASAPQSRYSIRGWYDCPNKEVLLSRFTSSRRVEPATLYSPSNPDPLPHAAGTSSACTAKRFSACGHNLSL